MPFKKFFRFEKSVRIESDWFGMILFGLDGLIRFKTFAQIDSVLKVGLDRLWIDSVLNVGSEMGSNLFRWIRFELLRIAWIDLFGIIRFWKSIQIEFGLIQFEKLVPEGIRIDSL